MINFKFLSEALPEDTFEVLNFDGDEKVSQLFHVELRLVSRDPDIDFDLILGKVASLSIITEGKKRHIHGMLAEFEQGGEWRNGLYEYRALLVPRLWMLSQSTQNQIFQNQSVIDIVESELKSVNKQVSNSQVHPLVELGVGSDADYDIYTIRQYDDREYVVQYKETDLNFISRLMEHEGIYYFFEHGEICEKLVITDAIATDEILNNSQTVFQSEASGVRYDRPVVYKLSRTQKQIPANVLVKDFNYREPSMPMQAMGDVAANGIGFVTEFGAHFKSPEEGNKIAEIRAQEHKCRQNVFNGESNIADFNCGHIYSLSQHFRSDYNQSYMLTRVRHQGSQEIESWGNIGSTNYKNQFSCIPALLPFRPQRLAQKPKLFGIMNGIIDSEQELGRADLDEQGRYKVQMPFDISGVADGLASRRIRMAQPYGGSGDDGGGTGMSFPLLKGTEVVWTCIDGDIDRPIITGAVPNPLKPSVTNTQNANSNVIKTSSGITMGFHDGIGSGANQGTSGNDGSLASQQQNQSLNFSNSATVNQKLNVPEPLSATSPTPQNNKAQQAVSQQELTQQQQQMAVQLGLTGQTAAAADHIGKHFDIKVPNYELTGTAAGGDSKDVYLRLGKADLSVEAALGGAGGADGYLSYVDGTRTEITKGDVNRHHYGIVSDFYHTEQFGFAFDNQYSVLGGHTYDATIGMVGEYHAGGKSSATVGLDVEFNLGISYDFGYSHRYTMTKGSQFSMSDKTEMEVDQLFHFKVDPGVSGSVNSYMEKYSPILASLAALSAAAPLTLGAISEGHNSGDNAMLKATAFSQYTVSAHLAALASIHWRDKLNDVKEPSSEFKLEADNAFLKVEGDNRPGQEKGSRHIRLETKSDGKDKTPSIIQVSKQGDNGAIILEVGGEDKEKVSHITLKVGNSSIILTDGAIIFHSPNIQFMSGEGGRVAINKDGLIMNKGDLAVNAGGAFIKKSVEANKVVGEVVTSVNGGNLGGGSPPKTLKEFKKAVSEANLKKFNSGANKIRAELDKATRSKDGTYLL